MKNFFQKYIWVVYLAAVLIGWVLFFVTKRSLVSAIVLVLIGLGILVHVLYRNKKDKKMEHEKEMKDLGTQTKVVEDDFDTFMKDQ